MTVFVVLHEHITSKMIQAELAHHQPRVAAENVFRTKIQMYIQYSTLIDVEQQQNSVMRDI